MKASLNELELLIRESKTSTIMEVLAASAAVVDRGRFTRCIRVAAG